MLDCKVVEAFPGIKGSIAIEGVGRTCAEALAAAVAADGCGGWYIRERECGWKRCGGEDGGDKEAAAASGYVELAIESG